MAPSVGAGGGQVDFELIVTDAHGLNHADYVSVFISNVNQLPVAHAGPDLTVNENSPVTLNGAGSHDPDLDPLRADARFQSMVTAAEARLRTADAGDRE